MRMKFWTYFHAAGYVAAAAAEQSLSRLQSFHIHKWGTARTFQENNNNNCNCAQHLPDPCHYCRTKTLEHNLLTNLLTF